MGDYADAVLDGDFCQGCGVVMDGEGYAQFCKGCRKEMNIDKYGDKIQPPKKKVKCSICHKKVWEIGLPQHMKDKHGI